MHVWGLKKRLEAVKVFILQIKYKHLLTPWNWNYFKIKKNGFTCGAYKSISLSSSQIVLAKNTPGNFITSECKIMKLGKIALQIVFLQKIPQMCKYWKMHFLHNECVEGVQMSVFYWLLSLHFPPSTLGEFNSTSKRPGIYILRLIITNQETVSGPQTQRTVVSENKYIYIYSLYKKQLFM